MAEQAKPTTPIKDAQAGIGGLKVNTSGATPRIEFRVSFPLTQETEAWMTYLARCCRFGSAYVDLRCPAPTLDEAADAREVQDEPNEPSGLFPGWPIACGKAVRAQGKTNGHVTTTALGSPCSHMPESAGATRCAIVWDDDPDNRCEREEMHPGAHRYPRPPLRDAGTDDPEELTF